MDKSARGAAALTTLETVPPNQRQRQGAMSPIPAERHDQNPSPPRHAASLLPLGYLFFVLFFFSLSSPRVVIEAFRTSHLGSAAAVVNLGGFLLLTAASFHLIFFFVVLSLPFSPSCSLVSLLSSPFLLFYPQSQRSHGQTRPLPCLSSRTLSFCFPLVFVSLRPSRRRSSFANADTYFVHWLADPVPGPTCDLSSSQLQAISQANSAPRTRSSLRFPVAATLLLRLLRRRKEPV